MRVAQFFSRRRIHNDRSLSTHAIALEHLEPRVVLDARVLITEVVAANNEGIRDEDGERTDWIELYNSGETSADLQGWYLTDDAAALDKWPFPAVTLHPEQHLIVYASGKDRSGEQLHTNFQLDRDGEYLGLIRPDRKTVEHEYSPTFGSLQPDRAVGIVQGTEEVTLVTSNAEVRVLVPSTENGGDQIGSAWVDRQFDDAAWTRGNGGVGFDKAAGFKDFIGVDVEQQMFDQQTSVYMRSHFEVASPFSLSALKLGVQYDDGFVAYLNGTEIARQNAPDILAWSSEATTTHRDSLAQRFEEFDISRYSDLLVAGVNVLAVHGMNRSTTSDDFLIGTEIIATHSLPIESTAPRYFARTTPAGPNGVIGYDGLADRVAASVERGFYDEPFDVTLSSATPGAAIIYTTDGSTPTADNGTKVNAADSESAASTSVRIEKTTNVRAVALKDGFLPSAATTETYLMLADVLQQDVQSTLGAGFPETWGRTEPDYGVDPDVVGPDDKYDGQFARQFLDVLKAAPTVSIATNIEHLFGDEGIYTNSIRTGFEWERPTSLEIMMPDGRNVQADAGIRIAGDNVRNFANSKKMSLRLEFREEYGPTKLRFALYDEPDAVDSFDTIILRGAYNDGWVHTPASTQFIRDQWARTTLLAMGNPQVHGRFVHVYLNGFYWGLYNAVERPVASFAASYFGGDKDEWDSLNTGQVRDGSISAWNELRSVARNVATDDQKLSNAAYQRLLGNNPDGTDNPEVGSLVDIPNYIDYLIVNFYGGNVDWPGRNYYVGRQQGPDSTGFKFFAWDTEKILNHGEGSDLNTNRINERDGVAAAYASLRDNEEFRLQFADRIHRHFFNGGLLYVDPENPEWDPEHPERNVPAATYAQIANQVEIPLIGESARWGDTQTTGTRNDRRTYTINDWRSVRDRLYTNYFPRRSSIVLRQFVAAGLYPELAAPIFTQHGGQIDDGFELTMTAPGTVYYTNDGTDPRQSPLDVGSEEAGIAPTAVRYDGPISLPSGGIVKSRTFADGQWSALNEATFTPGVPPLRVSEFMYHPRDPDVGAFTGDDYEFIEVVNISQTETVELTGVRFSQGVQFVFPESTLAPGGRAVVARNLQAFQQRYGTDINLLGEYGNTEDDFKLSNGGETLKLTDRFGAVIQEFRYNDAWVPSTDGQGYSLTILDVTGDEEDWNDGTAWRASLDLHGSPGSHDVVDYNDDGQTTPADIDLFCTGLRANVGRFDLNGNGQGEFNDAVILIERVLGTSLGDVDLNGVFDSSDLTVVFQSSKYEDDDALNTKWSEGDWNCDGDFTTRDFVDAFLAGTYVQAAVSTMPTVAKPLSAIAAALVDRHWQAESEVSRGKQK